MSDIIHSLEPESPPADGRFRRLDAARGFCALYVAVSHCLLERRPNGAWTILFRFGQEAVVAFFLISGFVIGWSCHAEGPWRGGQYYFLKRFARIYSVFLLAIPACWIIDRLERGTWVSPPTSQWIGNLLMLQDAGQWKPAVFCLPLFHNTPWWSLHYEWWFYMLFPFVMLLPEGTVRRYAVGTASVVAACFYGVNPNIVSRVVMYFALWWTGAEAAAALRRNRRVCIENLLPSLFGLGLSAFLVLALSVDQLRVSRISLLSFGSHPLLEARHLLAGIALVLAAFAWRRLNWIGFDATIGRFAFLAPISYSLYVIHDRSVANATYLHSAIPAWLERPAYWAVTLAFCWLAEIVVYQRIRTLVFQPHFEMPRA